MSLDTGIFEGFHLMIPSGSVPTNHLVHFSGVVDREIGSPFSRYELLNHHAGELTVDDGLPVYHSGPTYQHDAETFLTTLVTNIRIHFLAPHSLHTLAGGPLRIIRTPTASASILPDRKASSYLWFTVPQMHNSEGIHAHQERYFIWLARSDVPPRFLTVFNVIRTACYVQRLNRSCGHRNCLAYDTRERCQRDVLWSATVRSLPCSHSSRADNKPSPARVISRGVEIIRENRTNSHIRSQLQKALEGAASGENPGNFAAFSACFSGLFLHQEKLDHCVSD
jgi:hypothetical protein